MVINKVAKECIPSNYLSSTVGIYRRDRLHIKQLALHIEQHLKHRNTRTLYKNT